MKCFVSHLPRAGLLRAVGRDLFKIKIESKILQEENFPLPSGDIQYHVTFEVSLDAEPKVAEGLVKEEDLVLTCSAAKNMNSARFCELFPYHVVFDSNMVIKQVGAKVFAISNSKIKPGVLMTDAFEITHPHIPFTWEKMLKFITAVYNMQMVYSGFHMKGKI